MCGFRKYPYTYLKEARVSGKWFKLKHVVGEIWTSFGTTQLLLKIKGRMLLFSQTYMISRYVIV